MKFSVAKGAAIGLLALGLTMGLNGCATDAPPPPPPPPPAPSAPPVALASEISDAAAVYVNYIAQASNLSANFPDGQAVQAELQIGAAYEPTQLARGAVAYGAIVAMQDPAFRDSVRTFAKDNRTRADMVQRLLSDPSYAASIPGSDNAARRVIQALSGDGASMYKAGADVKQAAYDVQHQGWSKEFVAGRDERLAMARQNSVTLKSVQSDQSARLLTAALTGQGLATPSGSRALSTQATVLPNAPVGDPAPDSLAAMVTDYKRAGLYDQPYTNAVSRSLTIAAVAILGEGGPGHADSLVALLDESEGQKCFAMSKLMLYQCLAVAKPYYEDVFCLGQHILMDTGQCLGKMSSSALSFAPVQNIGFNDDGSISHPNAVPYLAKDKPAPRCKKGRKCKASASSGNAGSSAAASSKTKSGAKATKKKKK